MLLAQRKILIVQKDGYRDRCAPNIKQLEYSPCHRQETLFYAIASGYFQIK